MTFLLFGAENFMCLAWLTAEGVDFFDDNAQKAAF